MPYLPTAAHSIKLHVELANVPNTLGRLATAIGEAGAKALAEALSQMSGLKLLSLNRNSIGDAGKQALRSACDDRGGTLNL